MRSTLNRLVPPPPPRPQRVESAQSVAQQTLPSRRGEKITIAKTNSLPFQNDLVTEHEDSQPSLVEAESKSFESPLQGVEIETLEQKSPRSIVRRLMTVVAMLVAAFCLLLIVVSLSIDNSANDPGLQVHLMLPPDMEHDMPLHEAQLQQYWKEHAPSQAVELLEHVESMNRLEQQGQGSEPSSAELASLTTVPLTTTAASTAPMCVSFLVQSVSDLLAATNIHVSFPDILLRQSMNQTDRPSQQLLGSSTEDASDANGSKALVPFNNTVLESSLMSRMTAFRFPLLSWMHAGDQHVVVMPTHEQQELPKDGKVLSMEIRPCDEEYYDHEEEEKGDKPVLGQKQPKKKRRPRKILKRAAKKIQHEADKLKHGVQDTGKKIQQGIGGIKDKTGSLLMNVASWHKNKKWL
jgi:hypothetical protein